MNLSVFPCHKILKTTNKKRLLLVFILFFSLISFGQNYKDVIQNYLSTNLEKFDLLEADLAEWKITNEVDSKQTNVRYVYLQQLHKGIPVYNAVSNLTLKDNKVIFSGNSFVRDLSSKINTVIPFFKAKNAISQVAEQLKLGTTKAIKLMEEKGTNNFVFSKSGISQENISIELVYQPLDDGSVKLSWLLNIQQLDGIHWWNIRVDANTGIILQKNDWGVNCTYDTETDTHSHAATIKKEKKQSPLILIKKKENIFEVAQYNVFGIPVESPNHGFRSVVATPYTTIASPFGWHDTNGVSGAEFTITRGNNVYAHLDDAGNNIFGYSPEGGAQLNFNFPLDMVNKTANTYRDASVTNLFYMSNIMHDIWYQYGFDETSGNFQVNNYQKGGIGGDEVFADGQDGSGRNNANFGTPPDGQNPRMQMFLWDDVLATINGGALAGTYTATTTRFTDTGEQDGDSTGAPLSENPITADLFLMDDGSDTPTEACTLGVFSGLEGKIAVIRRGNCNFTNKIQVAQDSGAVGVLMVNNQAGLITMSGATTTINIPAVLITQAVGEEMITALQNGETISTTLVNYGLDGSFDNAIIAHEYGHGISNRLVGGSGNVNCLNNEEQLGEGWSDYFGLVITVKPGDTETTLRTIGTFPSAQPITGNGIRRYPYTTDMAVNPFSFIDVKDQALADGDVSVHGVGSIWATMLWDLHWKMISVHGFDSDIYNGIGGNNMTMQLVLSGLKLTPCSSGFVEARDAILAADMLLYEGVNQCAIWEVFARRGLGFSADSGDADSFIDQTEGFDMPPENVLAAASCNSALNVKDAPLKMFTVYPNPARASVRISIINEVKNATIAIYDINGRQVYVKKLDLKGIVTINTQNLSAGIYILKINNQLISDSQKIIIN
jgi:extracellular elastinolytic metalloproteinase